jgi:glucan biosynthesis protein C
VVAFLNPWHMPLLLVLAGAATWLALGHRRPRAYLGERTRRLLVPFLFGLLVIVPPQGFLAGRLRGGQESVASFLGDYWTVDGDPSGYTGSFTPAHLWFIGFLFLFSALALPLLARWRGRQLRTRWLLVAMPLVLLAANELPAPNDGPRTPGTRSPCSSPASCCWPTRTPSAPSTGAGGRCWPRPSPPWPWC